MSLELNSVPCPNQNRFLYPCIPATFQVAQLIANHVTATQIQTELIPRIEQKLRRRFTPPAWRIGSFWRNIDFFNLHSFRLQLFYRSEERRVGKECRSR